MRVGQCEVYLPEPPKDFVPARERAYNILVKQWNLAIKDPEIFPTKRTNIIRRIIGAIIPNSRTT